MDGPCGAWLRQSKVDKCRLRIRYLRLEKTLVRFKQTHLKVGQVVETDVVVGDEDGFPGVSDPGHHDGASGRLDRLFRCRLPRRRRPVKVDEYPIDAAAAAFHAASTAATPVVQGRSAAAVVPVGAATASGADGPGQEGPPAGVEAGT